MRLFITPLLLLALAACEIPTETPESSDCFTEFLPDADGDGFPGMGDTAIACEAPEGFVSVELDFDCDDQDDQVHPAAPEHCDGIDENCNNVVDEASIDGFHYHLDEDLDGFGGPEIVTYSCEAIDDPTLLEDDSDCDDRDPLVHPGAEEHCDGIDEDCNGVRDDGLQTGTFYPDMDLDGYGAGAGEAACIAPYAWIAIDGDCNDSDPQIHIGAPERCNGQDDDCDGTHTDETTDEDGDGLTTCDGDCDDRSAEALPGGIEVCDAYDNDCNGTANDGSLDAYEPNGTRDSASVIVENDASLTITGTISGPDDRSDWYAMDTVDDPDNFFNGDAFYARFTVTDLPPGVEASLHMYRDNDLAANPIRHVAVDDSWEDGTLEVERGGVWLSNDGNRYWAHLEIHDGYDCDASYSITLSNGG